MARNVDLLEPRTTSPWRRMSLGSWRPTGDSSIYVPVDLLVEPLVALARRASDDTGRRVSFTHIIGSVIARALGRNPEANAVVRFGRIYPRRDVDLFFHVVAKEESEDDLGGFVLRQADTLALADFAAAFDDGVKRVRDKQDAAYRQSKATFRAIPGLLAKWLLDLVGFVTYSLNFWSRWLRVPRDAFGSAMVTHIGSLGVERGFVPIAPYTRIPLVVAVGAVRDAPCVADGKLAVARVCTLSMTFDHRLVDGLQAARFIATMKELAANPQPLLAAPGASLPPSGDGPA